MARIEFTAKPEGMGPKGAWAFLDLPRNSAVVFGTKARVSVRLTVAGKTFRVSAFPDGEGGHQLNFNKAMQSAAGWEPGKAVEIVVEADAAPRPVAIPKELKAAFAKNTKARATYEALAPSHKKAYVDWIVEAKRAETREKRVTEAVARLAKGGKFWD
ncbi:MAG TPA: YdeI/OmpD-associated family protein [Thermoplasmata archaeon]|nr:YdeI/OmpD-associated family protein [Thermoplasmata archaeon]